MEENCCEGKEEAWMAFMGTAVAVASDLDGWRDLLADLKSPHGPSEDE